MALVEMGRELQEIDPDSLALAYLDLPDREPSIYDLSEDMIVLRAEYPGPAALIDKIHKEAENHDGILIGGAYGAGAAMGFLALRNFMHNNRYPKEYMKVGKLKEEFRLMSPDRVIGVYDSCVGDNSPGGVLNRALGTFDSKYFALSFLGITMALDMKNKGESDPINTIISVGSDMFFMSITQLVEGEEFRAQFVGL